MDPLKRREQSFLICMTLATILCGLCNGQSDANRGCIRTNIGVQIPGMAVPFLSGCLNGSYALRFKDASTGSHQVAVTIQSPQGQTVTLVGTMQGQSTTLLVGQSNGLSSTCQGLGVYMTSAAPPQPSGAGSLVLAQQQGTWLKHSALTGDRSRTFVGTCLDASQVYKAYLSTGNGKTHMDGPTYVQAFLTPTICVGVSFDTIAGNPISLTPGTAPPSNPTANSPPNPGAPSFIPLQPGGSFSGPGFTITRPLSPSQTEPTNQTATNPPAQSSGNQSANPSGNPVPGTPAASTGGGAPLMNPSGRGPYNTIPVSVNQGSNPSPQAGATATPSSNPGSNPGQIPAPGQTQAGGYASPLTPTSTGPVFGQNGTSPYQTNATPQGTGPVAPGFITRIADGTGLVPNRVGSTADPSSRGTPGSGPNQVSTGTNNPNSQSASERNKWVAIVVPMLVICVLTSVLGALAFLFGVRNVRRTVTDQMGELRRALVARSRSSSPTNYRPFAVERNESRVTVNPPPVGNIPSGTAASNQARATNPPGNNSQSRDIEGGNERTENGSSRVSAGVVTGRWGLQRLMPTTAGLGAAAVSKSKQRPETSFDQINARQSSEAGPSGSGHVAASRGPLLGSARTIGLWPKGDSQGAEKGYDVENGGRDSDLKKSRTFPAADEALAKLFSWARPKPSNPVGPNSKPPDSSSKPLLPVSSEPLTVGHVFIPSQPSWLQASQKETRVPANEASENAGDSSPSKAKPASNFGPQNSPVALAMPRETDGPPEHHGGGLIGGANLPPLDRENPAYSERPLSASKRGVVASQQSGIRSAFNPFRSKAGRPIPLAEHDALAENERRDGRIEECVSENDTDAEAVFEKGNARTSELGGTAVLYRVNEGDSENGGRDSRGKTSRRESGQAGLAAAVKSNRQGSMDSQSLGSTVIKRVSDVGKRPLLGTEWAVAEHSAEMETKGFEEKGLGFQGLGRDVEGMSHEKKGLGFGEEGLSFGVGPGEQRSAKEGNKAVRGAGDNWESGFETALELLRKPAPPPEEMRSDRFETAHQKEEGKRGNGGSFAVRNKGFDVAPGPLGAGSLEKDSGGFRQDLEDAPDPLRMESLEKVRQWFLRGDHEGPLETDFVARASAGGSEQYGQNGATKRNEVTERNGVKKEKGLIERNGQIGEGEPNRKNNDGNETKVSRRERNKVEGELSGGKGNGEERTEMAEIGRRRNTGLQRNEEEKPEAAKNGTGRNALLEWNEVKQTGVNQPGSDWESESLLFGKRPPRWDGSTHKAAHIAQIPVGSRHAAGDDNNVRDGKTRALFERGRVEGKTGNHESGGRSTQRQGSSALEDQVLGERRSQADTWQAGRWAEGSRARRSSDSKKAREWLEEEVAEWMPDQAKVEMIECLLFDLPEMVASVKQLRSQLDKETAHV